MHVGIGANRDTKATKSDDAEVLVHLWDDRALKTPAGETAPKRFTDALAVLRSMFLRIWKKRTTQEFLTWHSQRHAHGTRHLPRLGIMARGEILVETEGAIAI